MRRLLLKGYFCLASSLVFAQNAGIATTAPKNKLQEQEGSKQPFFYF